MNIGIASCTLACLVAASAGAAVSIAPSTTTNGMTVFQLGKEGSSIGSLPNVAKTPGTDGLGMGIPIPYPTQVAETSRTGELGEGLLDISFGLSLKKNTAPSSTPISTGSTFSVTADQATAVMFSSGVTKVAMVGYNFDVGEAFALSPTTEIDDTGDMRLTFDLSLVPFDVFELRFSTTVREDGTAPVPFNFKAFEMLNLEFATVPEPSTLVLLMGALAALGLMFSCKPARSIFSEPAR